MYDLAQLVIPYAGLCGDKWDPRSLVNFLVAQMRISGANPRSVLEIQVWSAMAPHPYPMGGTRKSFPSKTKLKVFAKSELFYFGLPASLPRN
ncbi:hypothetical protein AURDEDRAFT_172529 [Auricularia subglabra TFB-10046 SS5]|nr:hypothetical protein AURDEDRAFT_172529 [Auricularia subglabra TFB-10046 SS5]